MRRWQRLRQTHEPSATRRTAEHSACQRGEHTMTATFRPGETLCLVCGLVLYCPACLTEQHLPAPTNRRAFVTLCAVHQHQKTEVSL